MELLCKPTFSATPALHHPASNGAVFVARAAPPQEWGTAGQITNWSLQLDWIERFTSVNK